MAHIYILALFNNYSFLLLALQANQVEVKFTITSVSVEEDVESVELLATRSGNMEIASVVRLDKLITNNNVTETNNNSL